MTAAGAPDPAAPPPRKAAPGQPWSLLETIHLIDAYEEKWYSLKRGQLKAQQWEDVAASVAALCGFDAPSKTGTQCRHKIEKLRKRYRSERQRPHPSLWPYFAQMDRMERGPLPISVRPPPLPPPSAVDSDGSDSDEEAEDEMIGSNTRSINGILREGGWGFSRNPRNRKRRDFEEEEEDEEDEDDEEEEEEEAPPALMQLAAVVRRFGEGFVRMEKMRMEMMRGVERDWMEMEARRMEMVVESQRSLVERIAGAFTSMKKAKKSQDL